MYQILQRQELILTCNETGNEKKFSASLLTKDLIFKRLSFSNLNLSDFDLIKDVFYNSISIETLDSLKSNEKFKNRTIKSFSDYKKNTKENIMSENSFISSNERYLYNLKNHALNYENSVIKRIFSCNEDKMAYFITGALYPLKDTLINYKVILETYKERGISYDLIGADINLHKSDGELSQIYFYIKNLYKNMAMEDNELLSKELNNYLKKIDWNDDKNKEFNFTLLEIYVILPKLMSSNKERELLTNYSEIIKNYLLSKSEISRKNEFKTMFVDFGLVEFFEKTNRKKEVIELLEVSNVTINDLNEYEFKNKKAYKELTKIINIKDVLENKKVKLSCIYIINDNLIIKDLDFHLLFGTNSRFIKSHCDKFNDSDSFISKQMNDEGLTQNVYKIPLKNFQFSGEQLKRGFLEYLLKSHINEIDKNLSFNSYLHNKTLTEKIEQSTLSNLTETKSRKKI